MELYHASEFAAKAGVEVATLRFYEKAGLLSPRRMASGHLLYDSAAFERLRFIIACQRLQLNLTEIRGLLAEWDSGQVEMMPGDLPSALTAWFRDTKQQVAEILDFTERAQSGREDDDPLTSDSDELSIACPMTAVEQRQRAARWRRVLGSVVPEPIADGFRFRLPLELTEPLMRLAVADQECCTSYSFKFWLSSAVLHFEVYGTDEVASTLAEMFDDFTQ